MNFYFSDWQIRGKEHIPDGPVILVPNHQNAFLDAVLVICSSNKNPWSFTRADIFKSSLAKSVLTALKMIPIFRFRDGYSTLKNNQSLIDESAKKLNSGQSVLIFAEGSHSNKMQLGQLRKGVAKLSFLTNNELDIPVIPVGIQYYFNGTYKSKVLINFGPPIYTNLLKKSLDDDEKRFTDSLMSSLTSSLEKLVLNIEDPGYEQKLIYLQKKRNIHKDLFQQLKSDQSIIEHYPKQIPDAERLPMVNILSKYNSLFSRINLIIPAIIIRLLIKRTVSDVQFISSIKYGAGSFITPVYLLLAGLLIATFSHNLYIGIVYILTVVISNRFSKF